ncbi:MAG: glyoxylate/hydroxypyruvate reductase A [Pseudomonadota bacterium]
MTEKSPLLLSVEFNAAEKLGNIRDGLDGRPVIDWARGERPATLDGVKYALVWEFDHDLFDRMSNLEVIFSAGAGVDKILANPALPDDVPIVRFVDHSLTTRMSEWICLQCLMHLRQQRQYDALQDERNWSELVQPQASDVTIGIMGMGILGQDAAAKLKTLGFNVIGWSRSKKQIDAVQCFDANETDAFLAQTHYLVGLLPLTNQTRGFFNQEIFAKLAKHPILQSPVLINAGRGGSQIEKDIAISLENGTLGAVSLDVFETEPLSATSPLWRFKNAILTPHVAANSDVAALGRHVESQITRHETGKDLQFLVDRRAGY